MIMKKVTFRFVFYLFMKILSQVCHLCNFIMILSNYNWNSKIFYLLRENIYLLFTRVLFR